MTILNSNLAKMLIEKRFIPPQTPQKSGMQFKYTRDTEKGSFARIDLVCRGKQASCVFNTIDNKKDDLHIADCLFLMYDESNRCHELKKVYACLERNDSNYLTSYGLRDSEFNDLLLSVIAKINIAIQTETGYRRVYTDFFDGDFSLIYDHIRNICLVTLYSLILPSSLPNSGDLNSYIPSKEEYDELNKVVRLYTSLIGGIIVMLLGMTHIFGLLYFQANKTTHFNFSANDPNAHKVFEWLVITLK